MAKRKDVQEVPREDYEIVSQDAVNQRLNAEMLAEIGKDLSSHGIECLEYKVLVKPRKAEERTKGGIVLPEQVVEKDQHAAMEGEVCGMSPLAFSYDEGANKPEIGDTVVFARYSGITQKGNDGVEYRIMNDKDVVAIRRRA